jgi:LmbE family N-acetylglucosaminyl deacetylase
MGGVIAALAAGGAEIHYLTVTDGRHGNLDPGASPAETAAIRRREAVAAGRYLGASEFHFLDHEDGSLDDVPSLAREIAALIRRTRPGAVFCPDPWLPYESHWDHVITGRAAAAAIHMSGRSHLDDGNEPCPPPAIGFYFSARPNTVIDVSSCFDRKMEAVALHQSQVDAATLGMYQLYFRMKAAELAQGRGFALGEGLKALSALHTHCFVDAERI